MKRIISVFLCFLILACLIPNTIASAASYWEYDDTTSTLTIDGTGDLIGSPWSSKGKYATSIVFGSGLTGIGSYCFEDFDKITALDLPDGITHIDTYAFYSCDRLATVKLPAALTSIGEAAFYSGALREITIPAGVTSIGDSAFAYNVLTSVKLPLGITEISRHCFTNNFFTTFEIPNSVTTLGDHAFYICRNLASITIPASVKSIGAECFRYCSSLKQIRFEGNAPSMDTGVFDGVTATAYYPAGNKTWTEAVQQNYGGNITWVATQMEAAKPDAPVVKASNVASSGKIKLSWNQVDGAESYRVYRSTTINTGYKLLKETTGTSLTNTSAEAGKQYYYYVIAVNEDGVESAKSEVVTRVCDLPRPVLKASNVASTGKIKLTWDAIDDAKSYKVYRSTDGGKTYTLLKNTTGTSLTNTSVEAGTKYYYKVYAVHESNSSANSAYSTVVNRTCDLPRPVVVATNVSSTGKIRLTWAKIDGAGSYKVYRSTDGGKTYSLLKTTTGTSLTNTSTTAGNKYYYKVKAIHSNSAANSAYSLVVNRTCDLARPVAKVSLNNSGKPVIRWEAVEGAVEYTVYIYNADGELVKTASAAGLKLTHGSAVKGKTYSYRVVAVHSNTAANSAKSIAVSIKSK